MLSGIFPDLKISTFYYETTTALNSVNQHVSTSLPLESIICVIYITACPGLYTKAPLLFLSFFFELE